MCLKLSMCLNDFLDQSLTAQNNVLVETVVAVRGVTSRLLKVVLLAAKRIPQLALT